jgi:hypothetical protein
MVDKVYQLLAHGRWFSPGTPASPTIKPGQHDIAEILLKVALNTKYQSIISWTSAMYSRLPFICTLISDINDVLNIVIYVYTYWWYQWCTHHGNLFVHLLSTSLMSLISVHIKGNVEYITDVTNKCTYKRQCWVHHWHQWCTQHCLLCVHLLVTSVMYSTLPFMCTLISDMSDVLSIVFYVYTY